MLHDPGSYSPPQRLAEIRLKPAEKEVLRALASEWAASAALPVHREKAELWRRLNDLDSGRPMVWINEIPWHEMDVDGELTLQTVDEDARAFETTLRQTLYRWRHLRADMVVEPVIEVPKVIHSTGFGIRVEERTLAIDPHNEIVVNLKPGKLFILQNFMVQ